MFIIVKSTTQCSDVKVSFAVYNWGFGSILNSTVWGYDQNKFMSQNRPKSAMYAHINESEIVVLILDSNSRFL